MTLKSNSSSHRIGKTRVLTGCAWVVIAGVAGLHYLRKDEQSPKPAAKAPESAAVLRQPLLVNVHGLRLELTDEDPKTRKPKEELLKMPLPPLLKVAYFPYYSHLKRNFRMMFLNQGVEPAHLKFHYFDADTGKPHPKLDAQHATVEAMRQTEFFEDLGENKGHYNIRVESDRPLYSLICEPTTFGGKALYCSPARAELPKQAMDSTSPVKGPTDSQKAVVQKQMKKTLRAILAWEHPELLSKVDHE